MSVAYLRDFSAPGNSSEIMSSQQMRMRADVRRKIRRAASTQRKTGALLTRSQADILIALLNKWWCRKAEYEFAPGRKSIANSAGVSTDTARVALAIFRENGWITATKFLAGGSRRTRYVCHDDRILSDLTHWQTIETVPGHLSEVLLGTEENTHCYDTEQCVNSGGLSTQNPPLLYTTVQPSQKCVVTETNVEGPVPALSLDVPSTKPSNVVPFPTKPKPIDQSQSLEQARQQAREKRNARDRDRRLMRRLVRGQQPTRLQAMRLADEAPF